MTNEQLVEQIWNGDEGAYDVLLTALRPVILHEAMKLQGRMPTYDTEDLLQEGAILAWKIIDKHTYTLSKGRFSTYFAGALRKHYYNLYRDYTLKNLICIGDYTDFYGSQFSILVESDFAREYREKHREQCRRWYQKKKAAEPPKVKTPPLTKEERNRRIVAWQKAYYAAHPDKLAERREKNRIAQRRRYAAKKAAALAAVNA